MALDVTPDSLVLLDELGAATDPEEGGALGVAIVEHFRAAGAFTLVSTHLMALKIYGASTDGVVNGSMGFDEQTFEPTYRLRLGLPGKSAGLEIATRLGMPEDIMRRARRSMSDRERDVTRFLAELHRAHRADAGAGAQACASKLAELEQREKELAREWEKRETAKLKELERRTDAALARFEEQAQETIGKIAQSGDQRKAEQDAQRRVAKAKRELREDFQTTVLATRGRFAPGPNSAAAHRGGRARPAQGCSRPGARAPHSRQRPHRSGGRLHEDAGLDRRCDRGAAGGRRGRRQAAENVTYKPAPELAPVHQEINVIGTACRRGSRRGGRVSGPRGHGDRQPGPHRSRARHGDSKEGHRRTSQPSSARSPVLSGAPTGRRRGRDHRGTARVAIY